MYKKLSFVISSILLFEACSSVKILESQDSYGENITGYTLNNFKQSKGIKSYKFRGKDAGAEFEKIKNAAVSRGKDLIPGGIYAYAFVKGKDTLYANPQLTYWKYKDNAGPYTSEVFTSASMTQAGIKD